MTRTLIAGAALVVLSVTGPAAMAQEPPANTRIEGFQINWNRIGVGGIFSGKEYPFGATQVLNTSDVGFEISAAAGQTFYPLTDVTIRVGPFAKIDYEHLSSLGNTVPPFGALNLDGDIMRIGGGVEGVIRYPLGRQIAVELNGGIGVEHQSASSATFNGSAIDPYWMAGADIILPINAYAELALGVEFERHNDFQVKTNTGVPLTIGSNQNNTVMVRLDAFNLLGDPIRPQRGRLSSPNIGDSTEEIIGPGPRVFRLGIRLRFD